MSFLYSWPILSVVRNMSAVVPIVFFQVNSGALYFPYPPKSTRSRLPSVAIPPFSGPSLGSKSVFHIP
jgi:hypothetical protein